MYVSLWNAGPVLAVVASKSEVIGRNLRLLFFGMFSTSSGDLSFPLRWLRQEDGDRIKPTKRRKCILFHNLADAEAIVNVNIASFQTMFTCPKHRLFMGSEVKKEVGLPPRLPRSAQAKLRWRLLSRAIVPSRQGR
ncbi:hypothetical protein R1sor_003790 [Riccia sorocarpa]|uniref:Uncharacterized protein n=1 Tax=Riccia sorocarpa TaxID=122646 RepID=A0ABD3H2Y7_9MARC